MVMMNNQYKWMTYVGLEVLTLNGWATRGNSSFAPTIGMAHWIAGRRNAAKGTRPGLTLVRDGHGTLPGPLCNNYFGRRGEVVLVAAGRANHAGYGYWKGVSGNTGTMGTEAEAADNSDWTAEQKKYYVLVKIAELFCMWEKGLITWNQITSNRLVGHSEYALPKGRKQDINGFTMNQMRAQAAALIPGFKKRVNRRAIKVGTPPVFNRKTWKFVDGQSAPTPVKPSPGNSTSYRRKRVRSTDAEIYANRGTNRRRVGTPSRGYRLNVVKVDGSWTQVRWEYDGGYKNAWIPSIDLNDFYEDQKNSKGEIPVNKVHRTNKAEVPVRSGRSIDRGNIVGYMYAKGYRVTVIKRTGDYGSWAQIRFDGHNRWVEWSDLS